MLSKTDFLLYLDAPLHLWAKAHDQLENQISSPYEQHLFDQAAKIETLAANYVETALIKDYVNPKILLQQPFNDGHYQIRTDILIRDADQYDLYEVKSSTTIHTSHEYDLTFQVLLLEKQVKLRDVFIVYINKNYYLRDELELEKFFTVEEVTAKIEKRRPDVAKMRADALAILTLDTPPQNSACTKPDSCPCPELCHPNLPENPIYDLPYIGKKAQTLRQMGVLAMKDIPDNFALNSTQRKHLNSVRSGKPQIDHLAIRKLLTELRFPLFFLDFETFNPAIPIFSGYRPYEHIVFQYSLYKVTSPVTEPCFVDFLSLKREDPAPALIPKLLEDIEKKGSVIVWNESFEAGRNKDLARHCPEYGEDLLEINLRLFDLMRIFKDGFYIHPDFHGSSSLKAILPVLCPRLNYEDLEISNGEQAMLTWWHVQCQEFKPEETKEIAAALRTYCQRDTYGMVAIWQTLIHL